MVVVLCEPGKGPVLKGRRAPCRVSPSGVGVLEQRVGFWGME